MTRFIEYIKDIMDYIIFGAVALAIATFLGVLTYTLAPTVEGSYYCPSCFTEGE